MFRIFDATAQKQTLLALNLPLVAWDSRRPRNVYAGTTPPHVTARRRAANKVARRSRRVNRAR